MKFKTAVFALTLFLFSVPFLSASPKSSSASPAPKHLTVGQKRVAGEIISDLMKTEQFDQGQIFLPLLQDRVEMMGETTQPLLAKLPDCKLKQYLVVSIQTHEDLSTILSEIHKYKYYDLLKDRQTPKLVAKYSVPVNLQSSQAYGLIDQSTVNTIASTLSQVAIYLREQAQKDLPSS